MPLRMLGCALLLVVVAAFKLPTPSQTGQDQEETTTEPRWEYKVVRLDQTHCTYEQPMATALNDIGRKGWELMSYERLSPAFPKEADGTILIKPAATGPGKLNNPQTVDSFQGTMNLKMAQSPQSECRLLFKRISHAAVKP
ncbi:MAG TPA: hypothetical protein VI488_10325 [Candidatus Angelobacter sp.]